MKTIEKRILEVFTSGKTGDHYLTKRDKVTVKEDGSKSYYLWDTELVKLDSKGNIFLFPSSSTSEDDNYYHGFYGRNNYPPISQTTRSRLNVFIWELLQSGGFCQKNWELYFGNRKIETDSWYKIDRQNKRLVKISLDD